MCLSPAQKRKPSPTSYLGGASSKSKKLDLDDETLASMASIEVKKENIDPDEQEALENIELLSLLDRSIKQENVVQQESSTASSVAPATETNVSVHVDDFQIKIEPDVERTAMENKVLDADLQLQLESQANANKFLFYWFDLFEDQFNSNSTVYLFGKMPVKQKRETADNNSNAEDENSVIFCFYFNKFFISWLILPFKMLNFDVFRFFLNVNRFIANFGFKINLYFHIINFFFRCN